jgi:hypothetical protein
MVAAWLSDQPSVRATSAPPPAPPRPPAVRRRRAAGAAQARRMAGGCARRAPCGARGLARLLLGPAGGPAPGRAVPRLPAVRHRLAHHDLHTHAQQVGGWAAAVLRGRQQPAPPVRAPVRRASARLLPGAHAWSSCRRRSPSPGTSLTPCLAALARCTCRLQGGTCAAPRRRPARRSWRPPPPSCRTWWPAATWFAYSRRPGS